MWHLGYMSTFKECLVALAWTTVSFLTENTISIFRQNQYIICYTKRIIGGKK
jgi:hypothetical protein